MAEKEDKREPRDGIFIPNNKYFLTYAPNK